MTREAKLVDHTKLSPKNPVNYQEIRIKYLQRDNRSSCSRMVLELSLRNTLLSLMPSNSVNVEKKEKGRAKYKLRSISFGIERRALRVILINKEGNLDEMEKYREIEKTQSRENYRSHE